MWEQLFEVVELRVIDLIIVIMLFMVSSLVLRSSDRKVDKEYCARCGIYYDDWWGVCPSCDGLN
jgi:hypothetical protein